MSGSIKNKAAITPSYTRKSIARYQKVSVKRISLDFYVDEDMEIINKLDEVPNMSGYIKTLMWADIELNPNFEGLKGGSKNVRRYNKSDCKRVSILFNYGTESELIERISKHPTQIGYIRNLINSDINGVLPSAIA